jgi:sec-independent protein translocase protein TatC
MPDREPDRAVQRKPAQEEMPAVSESSAPAAGQGHPSPDLPSGDAGVTGETTERREDDEIQLYSGEEKAAGSPAAAVETAPAVVESTPAPGAGSGAGQPPSSSGGGGGGGGDGEEEDEEEEQMLKMSFLEHLGELRTRIIHALIAVAVGFFICFAFAQQIFEHASEPLRAALREMKLADTLYFTKPTDAFTLYLNLALVVGLFLSSPVVLYEVWAFISPGLYRRERRYAVPFIFFCSGLFITGGLFGYFIAFPYALKFLIGYGGPRVTPWITITEYMDMFWTVILGLGIVFELPVLMLFLGLLGILSPGFLLRNFRYAVLIIFIVAAVITPTSDVTNMMIFAMPMLALYLVGVGLVWIVTRRRRRREAQD